MKKSTVTKSSFEEFLADPPVAIALLVFGLVVLVLAILEFSQATGF